ncbi:SDR family NAD(P)-dependent oxidoreductase [Kordiimonas aquimaris]|uniref:SDR family NAD(P)-dependent oxidoreductase n=1 Tax=Kordiimonas aquimaris TaxID=707591 RepID=UPI0021CE5C8C|nr:SDR family oxidoreductase [Kordiimonas aquimaris]
MDLKLKGKKALITGGTRGIGAAIVKLLVAEGASVATCARSEDQVARCQKMHDESGSDVHVSVCDVGDKSSYANWVNNGISALGGIDIFIANVSGGNQPGEAGWQSAFNVDVMATVRGCELTIPEMAKNGGGSIVIISSISALESLGGAGAYGTMKAGLIAYAGQLAEDAGPHGIRVNAVSPGPIHVDDGFWGSVKASQPETYAAVAARHHTGRMGSVDEVANATVFLASSAASWVTGTNMIIDGGFTKRVQF